MPDKPSVGEIRAPKTRLQSKLNELKRDDTYMGDAVRDTINIIHTDNARYARRRADEAMRGKRDNKKPAPMASPSSFKSGGLVKKSGFAKVHKGERVLTRKRASSKRY